MSSATLEKALCTRLKTEEAFRDKPYFDCCGKPFRECACDPQGKLTLGYGRNLEDVELSTYESELLLVNDIYRAVVKCRMMLPFFDRLDLPRQVVLADMCFNMGIGSKDDGTGLLGFHKMLSAVSLRDFVRAADEMTHSKWARQVGARATRLAQVMKTGVLE